MKGVEAVKATLWTWGILLGLSLPTIAGAAGTYTAEEAYKDPHSGAIYYNITRDNYDKRVVVRTSDGEWKKWDETIRSMQNDPDSKQLRLDTTYLDSYDIAMEYAFDPLDREVVKGRMFDLSPDGKWGLNERVYYTKNEQGSSQRNYGYLLKNNQTGETKEWLLTSYMTRATWVYDNRIVYSYMNDKAKQEEILVFNPETDKTERIALGNFRGINPDKGYIIYTLNKPDRPLYLYNMKAKKSQRLKSWEEAETFLPKDEQRRDATSDLPQDFDLDAIPEESIPVKLRTDYIIQLDDREVRLPLVFSVQGQQLIPVKQLVDELGWKLTKLQSKELEFRYTLANGSSSIEMNPSNTRLDGGTLYMTAEQIKQLGYKEVSIVHQPE
nr:hypothetical protein [Paenibacillus apiarius]